MIVGSFVKHTFSTMKNEASVDYDDHCTVVVVIEDAYKTHSKRGVCACLTFASLCVFVLFVHVSVNGRGSLFLVVPP